MPTVYEDKLVEITDHEMVFKAYYFPFGNNKRVPWSQIESIEVLTPSVLNGSWRLWGSGNLRIYFPLDFRRPKRDKIFVASLHNSWPHIGFTVEDSQRVMEIFKRQGLL